MSATFRINARWIGNACALQADAEHGEHKRDPGLF